MKSKVKVTISVMVIFVLVFSQLVYANNGRGNGQDKDKQKWNYGQFKKLQVGEYDEYDLEKIQVKGKRVNSDTPPVIKGGRTLIPVRAITTALGCTVKWVSPSAYVVDEDQGILIIFNLVTGKMYKTTDDSIIEDVLEDDFEGLDDEIEEFEDGDNDDFELIESDTEPALVNSRTFVPLRFLAEELNYKVRYDEETGKIVINDLDEEDEEDEDDDVTDERLNPESVEFEDWADVSDVEVLVDIDDSDFEGIRNLTEGVDYDVEDTDDNDELLVTIKETYIHLLDKDEVVLKFEFEDGLINKFTLELSFIDDLPDIDQTSATFEKGSQKGIIININYEGYELVEIEYNDSPDIDLEEDEDYIVLDSDSVFLLPAYMETLDEGDHEILFNFENDDSKTVLKLELEIDD